ncbi:hypothetical protein SALWKB12_2079 [Snodgrassella communis]|nr:hypothetical protein SALWKB12_2079 [Snodgrassella communis]
MRFILIKNAITPILLIAWHKRADNFIFISCIKAHNLNS